MDWSWLTQDTMIHGVSNEIVFIGIFLASMVAGAMVTSGGRR